MDLDRIQGHNRERVARPYRVGRRTARTVLLLTVLAALGPLSPLGSGAASAVSDRDGSVVASGTGSLGTGDVLSFDLTLPIHLPPPPATPHNWGWE